MVEVCPSTLHLRHSGGVSVTPRLSVQSRMHRYTPVCVFQDVEKLDKLVTKLNKDKVGCQAALESLAMHQ